MAKDLYSEILNTDLRNHYELLGLKLFERDPDKIHKASLAQMKKLKAWDLHEDENTAKQIKEIHIQLSRAIGELQDAKKKQEYDKVLAFQLGIEVPYLSNASELELQNRMDTLQILTKNCQECGEAALFKDVICIQCGYNFNTGEKQTKAWSDSYSETFEKFPQEKNYKSNSTAISQTGLSIILTSFLKKICIIGLILFVVLMICLFFRNDSRYTLTMDGSHQYEKKWREFIENSETWQKYFDYKSKYSSRPYVAFKIFENYETGGMSRRTYKPKIEIREPDTGEIICTGAIMYIVFDQFKSRACSQINSLGDKCLIKCINKHSEQLP
jgi:uncharacterized Zn finger protein (UPF0148 family)